MGKKRTLIEKTAESLGLIKKLDRFKGVDLSAAREAITPMNEPRDLSFYPPPEEWDDWMEYDAKAWPRKEEKHYSIIPTTCFNCEAACGLLAYVDKETGKIKKFEGNPYHPASRGRNCAKGPATINQINDTDRILYPMKRSGKRGEGKWERVSWDDALDDIAARIRKALEEKRNNEIVYHVGRPGHEGYMDRVLNAWGVDGHNSHTNICSAGARFGYTLWQGYDRPSPDHANAKFILLLSAHLETGHYFNPHAQRIIEGMMKGAKLCVIDPRLSNTASMANYWLATYPGTEAALFLAIAKVILDEELYHAEWMETWVNWDVYLVHRTGKKDGHTFGDFIEALKEEYAEFTPQFAAEECGIEAGMIPEIAREIGKAGTHFACHNWRSAAAGNLGGWQATRALHFLSVLVGAVGGEGGTMPSAWNKFKPTMFNQPPAHKFWNELQFPDEYPLAHYEMGFLLPHMIKEGRGKLDVYFSRVFNPVWTNPDGFTWMEMFSDEEKMGMHIALTPTWSETSYLADYVLPMGHAAERHDLNSYETHSGKWIAFRQPVLREYLRKNGKEVQHTYEANPGEVWEEDEFWIELSWRIDPDGKLGIRQHFESPNNPGEKVTMDEYYAHIFENVPGLPDTAKKENLTALDYMKKYGAYEIDEHVYDRHLTVQETGKVSVDGKPREGFNTPSEKQEFFSQTMIDWKWPEHAIPGYIKSHVHWKDMDREKGEYPLIPTFRLPNLIHTRSSNAKWLTEIANRNPIWIHTEEAKRLGIENDELVRISTEIGYFVDKVWVTESIRPGVIACSHHIGRWRQDHDPLANRWAMNTVDIKKFDGGKYMMRTKKQIERYASDDPDSQHIFWKDGGVHQNITFAPHPDPISGMHCWHQKVTVEKARNDDAYGDVFVDTTKSFAVYKEWLAMTRPAPGPDNLRRPLWFKRPLKPQEELFYKK
ncbi:MAG: molybdopterin-dependent oxidoreductase [Flavobacteriales bacterium]|nr:molybdopterin-dependent oxidoreductase [Flavobacteriales bacterium]